jgi:hypothetical protein
MKWKPEPSLRFVGKESSRTARCRAGEPDVEQEKRINPSRNWSNSRVLAAIVFVTRGELAQGGQ